METIEKSTKKTWQKPEITLLSQGYVNGGAHSGYYEKSIKSSFASNIAGFQYVFKFNGGGSGLAHHRKTYYVS